MDTTGTPPLQDFDEGIYGACLGAMLHNGDTVPAVRQRITAAEDFAMRPHLQTVMATIEELDDRGVHVDAITVEDNLTDDERREIGGGAFLYDLMERCPSPGFAVDYADRIAARTMRGKQRLLVTDIGRAMDEGRDHRPLIDQLVAAEERGPSGDSWRPQDIRTFIKGEGPGIAPSMLARTDGACLLYPGAPHWLSGEPESGKSWLALVACAERIKAGECVVYVDFEDSPQSVVGRMLLLAVPADALAERFLYVHPEEPLSPGSLRWLRLVRPSLVVIDAVGEAMGMHDLDPEKNADAARLIARLLRPITDTGAALLAVDHVVKKKEEQKQWAIGAQHKQAATAVHYRMEALRPFAKGRWGSASILVKKDRHGVIRGLAQGPKREQVGELHLRPNPDESVTAEVRPPTDWDTTTMERISGALIAAGALDESGEGLPQNELCSRVGGKKETAITAIEALRAGGFIRDDGRGNRHSYRSIRRYDAEAEQ